MEPFYGDVDDAELCECGCFCVSRKDEKLRLICDPAVANDLFERPPHTDLPSAAALGHVEIDPACSRLHVRSGDVDCCLYQSAIPRWLKRMFAMKKVRKRLLPAKLRKISRPIGGNAQVRFLWRVVPMGWSWSVFLVTLAQTNMASGSSSDHSPKISAYGIP